MTTAAMNVMAVEAEHLLQVYRRGRVVIERGRGCRLFDSDGRSYLDLISGVGVASLGHAHPRLAAAIADQATTLLHTSNLFFHPLQGEVATRLAALSGLPRAFFCNSGTEAVEACLKFARRYWHAQGTKRAGFVAFEHGFHGRSIGSLSVTWDDHYRAPFSPLLGEVQFVRLGDPEALRARSPSTPLRSSSSRCRVKAAFVLWIAPTAAAIREACQRTGALLICDEVQSRARTHGSAVLLVGGRPRAGLDGDWQVARRRRADRGGDVHRPHCARRRRSAITEAPTAATCSPAAPRWCSSRN